MHMSHFVGKNAINNAIMPEDPVRYLLNGDLRPLIQKN